MAADKSGEKVWRLHVPRTLMEVVEATGCHEGSIRPLKPNTFGCGFLKRNAAQTLAASRSRL